eukprot:TRINITY_DN5136_c0_g2_i1.p1 TRINITY_DN5136_c0_g2~~TRINITY_DN5136_c0_g2_i1.p1  ORF type:complete len:244 (+),score=12.29 TRINITY_DN5136_c0_g2_i1:653-1384(+)
MGESLIDRNSKMAEFGMWFVFLAHPVTIILLMWWPNVLTPDPFGFDAQILVLKFIIADVLFCQARRSVPYFVTIGGGDLERGDGQHDNICCECQCVRMIRSKHCKICQRCVRKWDHHCPLLNGCIGEGNHGRYVLFLASTAVGLSHLAVVVGSTIKITMASTVFQNITYNFIPLFVSLTVIFLLAICCGLVVWHLFLISTNQTTPEVLHPEKCFWIHADLPRPYDKGFFNNVKMWFSEVRGRG